MSEQHSHTAEEHETRIPTAEEKGKGKAIESTEDISMGEEEDDDDSSEDEAPEGGDEEEGEPEDEDNMEEIDADNIIADGRRTRGRNIDFTKQEQEEGDDLDEDEDDDDDFEDPDDQMQH